MTPVITLCYGRLHYQRLRRKVAISQGYVWSNFLLYYTTSVYTMVYINMYVYNVDFLGL